MLTSFVYGKCGTYERSVQEVQRKFPPVLHSPSLRGTLTEEVVKIINLLREMFDYIYVRDIGAEKIFMTREYM